MKQNGKACIKIIPNPRAVYCEKTKVENIVCTIQGRLKKKKSLKSQHLIRAYPLPTPPSNEMGWQGCASQPWLLPLYDASTLNT